MVLTQVPLLTAADAGAGDEAAVEAGSSWAALMERASGHLARGVTGWSGYGYGLRVAILVGKGNNGGDGWGAARRLRDAGAQPWVVSPYGLEIELSEEAAEQRRRYLATGGRVGGLDQAEQALAWADVGVDALLGTGISGAPRGEAGEAATTLNRHHERGLPVVACDVPSGVSSDDGSAPQGAVRADLTVTFGGVKRGLVLHPGAAHAGHVVVGELGPRYRPPPVAWAALTAAGAQPARLAPSDDKRSRGVILTVAGSRGMAGAAVLCTRGALAAGGGLVTAAVIRSIQDVVAGQVPAATSIGLAEDDGQLAAPAAEPLADRAIDSDVVVAGPGLTPSEGTRRVIDTLRTVVVPLVLDADAINVYRDEPRALADHQGPLVLTPHARELSRIGGGVDGDDAWERRVERVPELAERLDATIVAKGPGTVVAAPDGRVWVTPTGGPALGAGGSGDVLAGVIGAVVADALRDEGAAADLPLATAKAVWLHGLAGQLAGAHRVQRSGSEALADAVPFALDRARQLASDQPTWPFDPTVAG